MSHREKLIPKGAVRMFVECSDSNDADSVAREVAGQLAHSLRPQVVSTKQYWKIQEWFEVLIELSPSDAIEESWNQIRVLASTWKLTKNEDELSAIWTDELGGEFANPKVRWISVGLFKAENWKMSDSD